MSHEPNNPDILERLIRKNQARLDKETKEKDKQDKIDNPPPAKPLKTHCKKGHSMDGLLNTKRDGLVRYCKTCMKESDQAFKARKSRK